MTSSKLKTKSWRASWVRLISKNCRLYQSPNIMLSIELSWMIDSLPYFSKSKRIWFDKIDIFWSEKNFLISSSDLHWTSLSALHCHNSTSMCYPCAKPISPWSTNSDGSTQRYNFWNDIKVYSFLELTGQNLWLLPDKPSSSALQAWLSISRALMKNYPWSSTPHWLFLKMILPYEGSIGCW